MPETQPDYTSALLSDFNTKLIDLEEKQRLLKDRVLLIGSSFVESREEIEKEMTELKIMVNEAKQDILKIKESLQRIAEELDNKARNSDIELLKKQARMFQPLELARLEDVKRIINEKRDK
ncbi:hypothetical protein FJZ19_06130 [Candidatus Pacearchaeota archaeon]|nr:hypothetical protein [Candidatus Pacearchaeota archaeon]